MFPCVQPGDMLHINSRPIEQVQVGDIAVFRKDASLFGHRVIATGTRDGERYIVTRPDRSRKGDDGPTSAKDVLGVITIIERRGTHMPLQPQPLRGVAALRPAAWEWWNGEARPRLIKRISELQRHVWYRRIASALFRIEQTRFSFVVRVPLSAGQTHDLYREMPPDKFDPAQLAWQGKPITRWMLSLRLNNGRVPAATATFAWHPPDCPRGADWQLEETQTRTRYRGAGLEGILAGQAATMLARTGHSPGSPG